MQAILDLPFNARLQERFGDLTEPLALAGIEQEVLA